jgi:ketosteroid isomerase-like protein
MKKFRLLVLVIVTLFAHNASLAQQSDEALIRSLENEERNAILKGDTTTLYRLMSSKIVVHNPENTVVNLKQIMQRIKSGKINYGSFDRQIEKVTFIGDAAIVMGQEILIPKGTTQNAGKTVTRRFTNFWMKENDVWKLSARQATIISIK